MARYEREFVRLAPSESETTMALISSWEQRGIEQGKVEMALRLLRRRFGILDTSILEQIDRLSIAQLDDLAEATLHFSSPADLEAWLAQR